MGRVDILTGTLAQRPGVPAAATPAAVPKSSTSEAALAALSVLELGCPLDRRCIAWARSTSRCALNRTGKDRLEENTQFFRSVMTERRFNIVPGEHPITPIMIGDAALAGKMGRAAARERDLCDRLLLSGRAAGQAARASAVSGGRTAARTSSSPLTRSPA